MARIPTPIPKPVESPRYYGLYRGTVVDNIDPMQRGRVMAACPDVSGLLPTTWATPCVPVAGPQMGVFVVPPAGAGIWLQFEGGSVDRPVWIGGFWGSAAEVPAAALTGAPSGPNIVIQTSGQSAIVLSDAPGPAGGILIKSAAGAVIVVNDTGISIDNGKGASIVLQGPTVSINGDALEIT